LRGNTDWFGKPGIFHPFKQYSPALWFTILGDQKLGADLNLGSWSGVIDWYRELIRESLEAGSGVEDLFNKNGIGQMGDIKAARTLYHYFQKNLRYVAIHLGLGGYKPHSCEKTLENLYGDCKDQSVALVSALREAGIEAYLVLVRTSDLGRFRNPWVSLRYFNHVIAMAIIDGEEVLMDPTCQNCSFGVMRYDVQGADALVIREGGGDLVMLPAGSPRKNLFSVSTSINVGKAGEAVVCDTLKMKGFYASRFRKDFGFREGYTVEQVARKLFLRDHPTAVVDSIITEGTGPESEYFKVIFNYAIPEYLKMRSTVFISPLIHKFHSPAPEEKRRYPLSLGKPCLIKQCSSLSIPDDRELRGVPDSLNIENKYFSYHGCWKKSGSKLIFEKSYSINNAFIPADNYSEYLSTMKSISNYEKSKVVVKKTKGGIP
jgi:hypothetical protein